MAKPLTADQLLTALRDLGVPYREVPGWRERGMWRIPEKGWTPQGIVIHHTAGGLGSRSVESYIADIINGDPAVPDKANAVVAPDGTLWLNAAGRANHMLLFSQRARDMAVAGSWPLTGSVDARGSQQNGNSWTYGVECIAAGAPNEAQRRTAVLWAAAIARAHGWTGQETFGHGEASDDRDFSDPGLDMGRFRRDVMDAARTTPRQEPPMSTTTIEPVGRIGERWRETGRALGQPTGPEAFTRTGVFQPFEGGFWLYSQATDAHPSCGKIRDAYGRVGFEWGPLGYPTTDEFPTKAGGKGQHYQGGSVYWSPPHGAHPVWGAIRDLWERTGWENGPLGYPTSDEFDGLKPGGRVQRFEGGTAYWTRDTGAHAVWGLIMDQYGRDGYEGGRWGYPVGDERRDGNAWAQDFQGGTLRVTPAAPPRVSTNPYVRPIKDAGRFPISAAYGVPGRLWQAGHHTGVDIACPVGTPVYATIGGDVRTASRSWGPAYGRYLIINDDMDGSDWGYAHLSRHAVAEGQHVETGQLIGWSGDTGHVTGAHLHMERRKRGGPYGTDLDPNLWP